MCIYIKAFYFLSIDPKNPNKEIGPSAVTNDQVVKDFAVSGYYWKQVKGFYTESILDDVYEKLSWHHDPLPNHDGDAEGTIAIWVLINVLFLVLTCCCGICFCTWCLGKRKRLKFDDIEKMNKLPREARFFDVNGLWYFYNGWMVRMLYSTTITPNQITVLSFFVGLLSMGFYVSGR